MQYFSYLLFFIVIACCKATLADELKPDGHWKGNGGAAISISSGNTNSKSLNLTANAARQTTDDKLSLYAQMLSSSSESTTNGITSTDTTTNQWLIGTRYDRNITGETFGFGGLDFSHDQIKLLSLRSVVSGGFGYHMIKDTDNQWDVFSGLAYRSDKYNDPGILINNVMETSHNATELLLGEESNHKLSDSTSFMQKLVVSSDLSSRKGILATFDTGLQVTLNKTMSLSVTLQDHFDSLAQSPVKNNDLKFFTGINVKFGG